MEIDGKKIAPGARLVKFNAIFNQKGVFPPVLKFTTNVTTPQCNPDNDHRINGCTLK